MREFKDMLSILRKRVGLSQRELAETLHISPGAIGMYESGKRYPTKEIEETIADFFNVSIDALRGKTESLNDDFMLSAHEIEIIKIYRNATESEKKILYKLIKSFEK